MEDAAYASVTMEGDFNAFQRDTALVSIAYSLKRIADAQERQANQMDAMTPPPPFEEQLAAVREALGK